MPRVSPCQGRPAGSSVSRAGLIYSPFFGIIATVLSKRADEATILRLAQQWHALSDPAMADALYEIESMRRFAGLELNENAIADETTIFKFRRLLEQHGLAVKILEAVNAHLGQQGLLLRQGTIVDATIIQAPSSTKNRAKQRDPEMHQTKKANSSTSG